MNTNFKLASVHGAMYTGGNVVFAPDGRSLLSPVHNYINNIDLYQGSSINSHVCNNSDIQVFDVSPDGDLIIAIGSRGLGFFYSLSAQVVLDSISFPPQVPVSIVKFSPCGRYVAIGLDTTLQVYTAPARRVVTFHGCHRIENIHAALTLPITTLDWSADGQHLLVAGQDARMRIFPRIINQALQRKGYAKSVNNLIGHRTAVLGAFFTGGYLNEITAGEEAEAPQPQDDGATGHRAAAPNEEMDTKFVVSVSHDNAIYLWRRTAYTRKDLMKSLAGARLDAKVSRGRKRQRSDGEGQGQSDDEGADPGFDTRQVPETVLERSRRDALATTGVTASDADDRHLPATLRYAYEVKRRHLLQHKGKVSVVDYHKPRSLLVIGYNSGIFAVHSVATVDCALIHLLSITAQALTACRFSPSGDHIAFGSAHLKQLLVWDWRGESYLLKEQAHYYDITTTAVTADGQCVISGGEDGKVKVWRAGSGQCFTTFVEHQAGIVGIATSNNTNAFFTASKDGTARGYDLVRFRNFRVYTPENRTQLSCIAVDPSGEVLAVGSSRDPRITLFSVQTGRIIDVLQGHEGPVTCLAFHPNGTTLASGALDKSLIIWDIFGGTSGGVAAEGGDRLKGEGEVVAQTTEVLSVAYSHNGTRMAALLMSGEITIYDAILPGEPAVIASFNTKNDAAGGWSSSNIGPNTKNNNARFTQLAFSPDGEKVVAAGESKWIVMYHAAQGFVLRKWPVTVNLDVEGAEEQFKWQQQTEAGNINDIDVTDDDPHLRRRGIIEMPGSKARHFATGKRKTELVARVSHLCFAAHGRSFVAATPSEGLLVFSLDVFRKRFIPLELAQDLTVTRVKQLLGHDMGDGQPPEPRPIEALVAALLLRDASLVVEAMRLMPAESIVVAVRAIPTAALPLLILLIAAETSSSPFLQHALLWAQALLLYSSTPLLDTTGGALANNAFTPAHMQPQGPDAASRLRPQASLVDSEAAQSIPAALKYLHRAIKRHTALRSLSHENLFALQYIQAQGK